MECNEIRKDTVWLVKIKKGDSPLYSRDEIIPMRILSRTKKTVLLTKYRSSDSFDPGEDRYAITDIEWIEQVTFAKELPEVVIEKIEPSLKKKSLLWRFIDMFGIK